MRNLYVNAPRLMEVSLLLSAVWLAFSLLQSNPDAEQSPVSMLESHSGKTSLVSMQSLTAVPLFGKREAAVAVKQPITPIQPVIKESRPDIKVIGTVVAGDSSAAIMTVGASAETTFFLGDVLYGRAFLREVKEDAVIISNHGNDERVSM